MLGTARILTFAFRALVVLLLVSMLWISVAGRYTEVLVSVARPLAPDGVSMTVLGSHIRIEDPALAWGVSIEGLTLHYGLILMVVLVLAAVGIGLVSRLSWLLTLVVAAFLVHVLGVALLARGVVWASTPTSPEDSEQLVFSLFAVFWGLLPAVIGVLWCYLYWIPRSTARAVQAGIGKHTSDAPLRSR